MNHACDGKECQGAVALLREAWSRNDLRAGIQIAREAVPKHPECPTLGALGAHVLLWAGHFDDALGLATAAVSNDGGSACAWAALAEAHAMLGAQSEAEAEIEKALAIDRSDPWILEKALSAFSMADINKGIAIAEEWRDQYPEDPKGWGEFVAMLQAAGRFDEAEQTVDEGLSRFPDAASLLHRKARILARQQKLLEAVEMMGIAAASMPGDPQLQGEYASYLAHAKEYDSAEQMAREALTVSKCAVQAYTALSLVCAARGRSREAAQFREQAADAIPAMRDQKTMHAALTAIKERKWKAVLHACEQLERAALPVTQSLGLQWKADALLQLGRLDECQTVLDKLAGRGSRSADAVITQASVLERRGRTADAIEVLGVGVREFGSVGQIRGDLVRLFVREGRRVEADEAAQNLVDDPPRLVAGFVHAYMALESAGYRRHASVVLAQGRRDFPDSEELQALEALTLLDNGDTSGARQLASTLRGQMEHTGRLVRWSSRLMDMLAGIARRMRGQR